MGIYTGVRYLVDKKMNREELKLSLVEIFSKQKPVTIELTQELFDLFRKEFWQSFRSGLESSCKEGHENFYVNKSCISWWSTTKHRLYKIYYETCESDRCGAFAAFIPIIIKELDEIQIPYSLKDDYTKGLKIFEFSRSKLKEFSNVERLGVLR